jgi:hypothetical protein
VSPTPRDDALRLLAEIAYGGPIPHGIRPIVPLSNFNDQDGRTQDDVLAAFGAAIQRADDQLAALA